MKRFLISLLIIVWGSGMCVLSYELWLNQQYTLKLEQALYQSETQNQLLLQGVAKLQQKYQALKVQCGQEPIQIPKPPNTLDVKMEDTEYPQKDWIWGCRIRGRTLEGNCLLTRFTKIGDADNNLDTDEPQILGFTPGNVKISRDGHIIPERIPEKLFLKPKEMKILGGAKCSCQ